MEVHSQRLYFQHPKALLERFPLFRLQKLHRLPTKVKNVRPPFRMMRSTFTIAIETQKTLLVARNAETV
jgi:hypothetical protein